MSRYIDLYFTESAWGAFDGTSGALIGDGERVGADDWHDAALIVREHAGGKRAEIRAIAGGACTHYLTLPWSDVLMVEEVGDIYVQEAFLATYGNVANDWALTMTDAPFGRPRLAAAIDAATLQGLGALTETEGLRVVSVVPAVSVIFGEIRHLIRDGAGILGFPDGRGVSLLRWQDHDAVDAAYLPTDHAAGVEDWMARMELVHGSFGHCYWIGSDADTGPQNWKTLASPTHTRWRAVTDRARGGQH